MSTTDPAAIEVPYTSLHPDTIRAPAISSGWSGRLIAVVLILYIFGLSHADAICGNGDLEPPEECDDGGTCIGGSNAGTHCTAESDCVGNGMCVGGTKDRSACADDTNCFGGACRHCIPQGGDGCAANCTLEHDVSFALVPGQLDGLDVIPGTSGVAVNSDFLSVPLPFGNTCYGGENASQGCGSDYDCPNGMCVPSKETLTVGKLRGGTVPLVIKAEHVQISGDGPQLSCFCVRGVQARTCGGTVFDADGVTPTTDCSLQYTAGDSVCLDAGKPPCAFVHGAGNTASGTIGCDGLDGINVTWSQDSGGMGGIAAPPIITSGGSGGSGAAVLHQTLAVSAVLGQCTGPEPSIYGPDGVYCTPDDPLGGIVAFESTSPAVTGTATAVLHNANGMDGLDLGPVSGAGVPFDCEKLASGSAAGADLAQTFTLVHLNTVGDVVVAAQFSAGAPVTPPNTLTPTPTPTRTPIYGCGGDCNNDGSVTITELITLVNIALGSAPLSGCVRGDIDGSGDITIDEIIVAVNWALTGCRTPTPTP